MGGFLAPSAAQRGAKRSGSGVWPAARQKVVCLLLKLSDRISLHRHLMRSSACRGATAGQLRSPPECVRRYLHQVQALTAEQRAALNKMSEAPCSSSGGAHTPRRGGGGLFGRLRELAESVGEVVASAGELLIDNELRRKGATYIVQEASRGISEAQRGLEASAEAVQTGARARINAGARGLQSVLRNIERQIVEFQRQQQARDLASELAHHHKLPVDIQLGRQVLEDMPQDMRARLWYVLLQRPDLAAALMGDCPPEDGNTAGHAQAAAAAGSQQGGVAAAAASAAAGDDGSSSSSSRSGGGGDSSREAACGGGSSCCARVSCSVAGVQQQVAPLSPAGRPASPFAPYSSLDSLLPGDGAAAAAGAAAGGIADAAAVGSSDAAAPGNSSRVATESAPDIDDLLGQASTAGAPLPPPATAAAAAAAVSEAAEADVAAAPLAPNPWSAGSSSMPIAPNPWAAAAAGGDAEGGTGAGAPAAAAAVGDATAASLAAAAAGGGSVPVEASGEGWEFVPSDVPSATPVVAAGAAGEAETLQTIASLVAGLSNAAEGANGCDPARAAQQAVLKLMAEVPWEPGVGIPASHDKDCEYARLLAAGCGAVEDVILRDVPRTFPEHPLFSAAEGQGRLLRLLKAYAAADPEVSYCQGQAFAAGVLLMYLPEEPAFRLYHRLMTSGPTLRRFYVPGLEPLQAELSRFELLLASHAPQLHQHLLDSGLPALLYAAQWFMTGYSCPFPGHVAARVIDILLQSPDDAILPRLGLAVMEALQEQLLGLDDFEQLITAIKVKPLSWSAPALRRVINSAMESNVSEAELAAAAAAVRAEGARAGRHPSFSSRHLRRSETAGGHVLVPGPMGPRTQAAAAAAAEAAAREPAQQQQQQQQAVDPQPSGGSGELQGQQQAQLGGSLVGSNCSSSGVLGELDAALVDMLL